MSIQVEVFPRGLHRVRTSGPLGITWGAETRRVGAAVPATDLGKLRRVRASTRYEDGFGGHDLASWAVEPFAGYPGGMFRPGDHVRVWKGGGLVWEGGLSEAVPGDGVVEFQARGYAYSLSKIDSILDDETNPADPIIGPTTQLLGPGGVPVPNVKYGWEYAVDVLGLPISQVVGTQDGWGQPRGESRIAQEPTKLADIITENAREVGQRWAVWGRTLVLAPDSTTPLWTYEAPDGVIGTADTDYATHVFVWYVDEGPAAWDAGTSYVADQVVEYEGRWWKALISSTGVTPEEGSTWTETPVIRKESDFTTALAVDTGDGVNRFDTQTAYPDYRGLGKIAPSRAQDIADNLLSQVKGRFVLNGSFTIGPDSGFKSIGGGAADIAFIHAGDAMRLTDLRTSQGNLMPDGGNHLISQTEWSWEAESDNDAGTEQTTITPLGAVPRSISDILRGVPLTTGVA